MPAYHELRDELKTGDLILFSGKGAISNVIKLFSGGKWSHVGMVLRVPALDDAVLLWESTTLSDIPDIESELPTKGVQVVPLSQRLSKYRGGEDLSSVFCSELVAEAYQAMGLLDEYPDGLPSNEYTPIDFSDQRRLKLKSGYNLKSELEIAT